MVKTSKGGDIFETIRKLRLGYVSSGDHQNVVAFLLRLAGSDFVSADVAATSKLLELTHNVAAAHIQYANTTPDVRLFSIQEALNMADLLASRKQMVGNIYVPRMLRIGHVFADGNQVEACPVCNKGAVILNAGDEGMPSIAIHEMQFESLVGLNIIQACEFY